MAIRIQFEDRETGATYDTAHIRVLPASIKLDFVNQLASFDVLVYFNQTAATGGRREVARRTFILGGAEFVATFGTPITNRAYAFLKTLPEFSGGQDV